MKTIRLLGPMLLFAVLTVTPGCRSNDPSKTEPGAANTRSVQTFYVATNGNDAWSGRRPARSPAGTDGPFATIERALKAARDFRAQPGMTGQRVTIFLRQGTWFLDQPLVLKAQDSFTTISAFKKEEPRISGGQRISGWTETVQEGRTLWVADVPRRSGKPLNFHQLWVNGGRAVRARHPDSGYLKVRELPDATPEWMHGHSRFGFAPGDIPSMAGATNAEVVVMNRWVESRLPIAGVDEEKRIVSFGKRSVFQLQTEDLYYLEGAMAHLNVPGEWCLDPAKSRVYYVPGAGERINTAEIIAPLLQQVVRFEGSGKPGDIIEGVVVQGITFSHTEWYFPDSGAGKTEFWPGPVTGVGGFGQAAVGVPGAVWAAGMRDSEFRNCRFTNLGTYGLELARGCATDRVVRCEFGDLGAGGIKIGETAIHKSPDDHTVGIEVSDCHIHDGGKVFHSAIGIWIGQSSNNLLTHNLIHDFYYTGISIGWTWGYGENLATNNLVTFNHVHHIGKKSDGDGPILSDMAGIYTLGMQPGTRIINNLWHDVAGLRYGGWGIYFDEGSSSILAQSNVVYRTTHGGFHQHYGATNQVWNNIFAFARDFQVQRSRPEPHISFSFKTNVVYFDTGTLLGGTWDNNNYEMDWNVYYDARPEGRQKPFPLGYGTWEKWQAGGHDKHSVIGDPLFLSPQQYDFHLQKGSPALKQGFQAIDLHSVGIREPK